LNESALVRAFSELAAHYEATVDWEVRELCGLGYRELIGYLARFVPASDDQVVLDVASGTAVSSVEIAKLIGGAGRIVGIDITPEMLAHGTGHIAQAGLAARISQVCGSGMQMPFVAASFDVTICGLGTHHMDVQQLLVEVRRVLKRGGYLVLADVGAPPFWRSFGGRVAMGIALSIFKLFWRSARARAEADAFSSIHTAKEWRELLTTYGFGQVEITEWPPRRFWYPCALVIRAALEATL
jgi:ubiquinone/menaquinone biosynthesis C-methylase UbiE